jgi:hypothetical protein
MSMLISSLLATSQVCTCLLLGLFATCVGFDSLHFLCPMMTNVQICTCATFHAFHLLPRKKDIPSTLIQKKLFSFEYSHRISHSEINKRNNVF